MKYNLKHFLVISALVVLGTACSKKIDEGYANPNYDVKVAPEGLLPQIVASMAGNYGAHGPMNDIRYIGAYVQNFAYYTTLSNFDRMGYTNTDVAQSFWRSHYYDIGQNNGKYGRIYLQRSRDHCPRHGKDCKTSWSSSKRKEGSYG